MLEFSVRRAIGGWSLMSTSAVVGRYSSDLEFKQMGCEEKHRYTIAQQHIRSHVALDHIICITEMAIGYI